MNKVFQGIRKVSGSLAKFYGNFSICAKFLEIEQSVPQISQENQELQDKVLELQSELDRERMRDLTKTVHSIPVDDQEFLAQENPHLKNEVEDLNNAMVKLSNGFFSQNSKQLKRLKQKKNLNLFLIQILFMKILKAESPV